MYCAMHPRLRTRRTSGGGLLRTCRWDRCTPRVVDLLGLLRRDGGGVGVGHLAQGPPELGDVASQVGADAGCLDLVGLPAAGAVRGVVLPEAQPTHDNDGVALVQG